MKLRFFLSILILLMVASVANSSEPDYLARHAEESEIKAIAVVSSVQRMSRNSDGTFKRVTFKRVYAITPYTPKKFVGSCKTMESRWQKRSPDVVYFKPKRGQKVYVTITTNGGAITSYTLLNRELETVLKEEPWRVTYSKGRAIVTPDDE